jgi:hypothetical protein
MVAPLELVIDSKWVHRVPGAVQLDDRFVDQPMRHATEVRGRNDWCNIQYHCVIEHKATKEGLLCIEICQQSIGLDDHVLHSSMTLPII